MCPSLVCFPQSTVHDSVEDARTALLLYRRYLALQAAGDLPKVLEELYAEGRASGWKVVAK